MVEDAAGVDQDVAFLLQKTPMGKILDLNLPDASLIVPRCTRHLVACFAVLSEVMFHHEVVEVVINFLGRSVYSRPVILRCERPRIVVCLHITSDSARYKLLKSHRHLEDEL